MARKQFRGEKIDKVIELFKRVKVNHEAKALEHRSKYEEIDKTKSHHMTYELGMYSYYDGLANGIASVLEELEREFPQ